MISLEMERDMLKAQTEISNLKVRYKLLFYMHFIQLKLREKDDDIAAQVKQNETKNSELKLEFEKVI